MPVLKDDGSFPLLPSAFEFESGHKSSMSCGCRHSGRPTSGLLVRTRRRLQTCMGIARSCCSYLGCPTSSRPARLRPSVPGLTPTVWSMALSPMTTMSSYSAPSMYTGALSSACSSFVSSDLITEDLPTHEPNCLVIEKVQSNPVPRTQNVAHLLRGPTGILHMACNL